MQWNRTIVVAAVAVPCGVAPGQTWIRQFGTPTADFPLCVAAGAAGELYTGGVTEGALAAPNAGDADAWFARFDGSGTALWTRQIGTPESDATVDIVTDATDGAWIAGSTKGSLGGPSAGDSDVWLARVDGQGGLLVLAQFGTADAEGPYAAVSDGQGGLFVAAGRAKLIPQTGYYHPPSAFVARHDLSGAQLWSTSLETGEGEWLTGIAPDGAGGVFVGGSTRGSLGGPHLGWSDLWLARFDGTGALVLLVQWGTANEDRMHGLASDGQGGVFIVWNEKTPTFEHTWRVLRVDAAGQPLWERSLGTFGAAKALNLAAADGGSGAYVVGRTRENECAVPAGQDDIWILHFDSAGLESCFAQFGSGDSEQAYGFVALPGRSFVVGSTLGTLGGPTLGSLDIWMARFDDQAVEPYCTAGTTSNGCEASIAGTGTPSVSATSGFTIDVVDVDGQRAGLVFYGLAPKVEDPWGSSWLCVRGPWQRTPVQSSGGTPGACDGALQLDWNAYRASFPQALGFPFVPGDYIYSQAWFRDPLATEGSQLSDALAFVLQP